MANSKFKRCLIVVIVLVAVAGAATEVDIATKYQGRIAEIHFREGDFLEADQVVARSLVRIAQSEPFSIYCRPLKLIRSKKTCCQ